VDAHLAVVGVVAALGLVVLAVRQRREREDGDLVHLVLVGDEVGVGDAPDERRHGVPRHRLDVVEAADVVGRLRVDSDLLVGLSECCVEEVVVFRFAAAAGERHLPGVVAVVRALDEHDVETVGTVDDGNQDRGTPLLPLDGIGVVPGNRVQIHAIP